VDFIAGYCIENDTCWLVPIDRLEGVNQMHIRFEPARNNQLAAINSAAEYEFKGAVAQLARASEWHSEGRRFDSDQLHPETNSHDDHVIGAEEFGLHAPRYSQRAAAGETFLITRRGRPMARLVPPDEDAVNAA
jgi:hypothetical protein